MTIDHPATRETLRCPICSAAKDRGLVTCWACYRRLGLKYGNPQIEKFLDGFEASLTR